MTRITLPIGSRIIETIHTARGVRINIVTKNGTPKTITVKSDGKGS